MAASPQATAKDRNNALQVCEAWKNDISNLPIVMSIFSSPESDTSLVLFIFNATEYMIKFLYESITEEQKQTLKDLLSHKILNHHGFPRMFREKLGGLVVELAVREWPQRWGNLLDQILTIQDLEFATNVLCEFVHTIHFKSSDESFWDGERKSELQSALSACIQPISAWLLHHVQGHAIYCTRVFTLLCSWGHFEYSSFKRICLHVIKEFQRGNLEPQVFADFLNEIGKRSLTVEFEETPMLIFSKDLEKSISAFYKEYGVFGNLLEAYLNCATEFYANTKKPELIKQQTHLIEQVYNFALQHLAIPSLLIKASCFSYITSFTNTESQANKAVSALLEILSLEAKTFYNNEHNERAFEDDFGDFKSGFNALQAVVCDFYRSYGAKYPNVVLGRLVTMPIMNIGDARAILIAIDHCLRNLKASIAKDTLMKLYQLLVGLSKNGEIIYECLSALTTFTIYLTKNFPNQPITDFVGFMFSVAGAPNNGIDIKCRAFSSILKLVSAAPERFVNNVADLISLGQYAQGQRELKLYVELVLVLAAAKEFESKKFDLLNCIITPLLAQLDGFPLMSENEFLSLSGMQQLNNSSSARMVQNGSESAFRNNACNALTLIQTCSKRLADVNFVGVELALRPVIERFFRYVFRFFTLLVNIQYWPEWNQKLAFELFCNDYSSIEVEDEVGVPYFNRWHVHMLQICAMSLSYLEKCEFTSELFFAEFGNFSSLFERVQRSNTRNTLLKYIFEPLASKNCVLNWAEFFVILLKYQPQSSTLPAYETAMHGYLNQVGSFLAVLFVTTESLHQKVEATIDLEKKSIIESPAAVNTQLLLNSVELVNYLIELLEWRLSGLSTKMATVLFHHLTSLLQKGHPEMKELLLVHLPSRLLCLLDQEDLQGLYIALIAESFKWLIFYNQSQVIHKLVEHPAITEEHKRDLMNKLQSSSNVKSQRTELRKCLAPLLLTKKAPGGVVKKLSEKLVIMQKLLKQKQDTSDVDFSALFDL